MKWVVTFFGLVFGIAFVQGSLMAEHQHRSHPYNEDVAEVHGESEPRHRLLMRLQSETWNTAVQSNNAATIDAFLQAPVNAGFEVNALLMGQDFNSGTDSIKEVRPTALHYAAFYGLEPTCDLLLRHGATVNAVDSSTVEPLFFAVFGNRTNICNLLISQGASGAISGPQGFGTPLFYAVQVNNSPAQTKILLRAGANANTQADNKLLMSEDSATNAVVSNTRDLINGLNSRMNAASPSVAWVQQKISAGAVVTAVDGNGKSALCHAAQQGRYDVCAALLNAGANFDELFTTNSAGTVSLDASITHPVTKSLLNDVQAFFVGLKQDVVNAPVAPSLPSAMRLTDSTALPSVKVQGQDVLIYGAIDALGRTALHYAVQAGNVDLSKALVTAGALSGAQDVKGSTPWHFLMQGWIDSSNDAVVGELPQILQQASDAATAPLPPTIANYEGETPLHSAAGNGHSAAIKSLVTLVDVNAQDLWGDTPLHWAAGNGKAAACAILLGTSGISVNVQNVVGKTALHYAAAQGSLDVCNVLLQNGAHKKTKDEFKKIAADYAANPVVKNLLTKSKEVSRVTTVLDPQVMAWFLAVQSGTKAVAAFLADPENDSFNVDALDPASYKGALHYAAERGLDDMCTLLLQKNASVNLLDAAYKNTPLYWAASNGQLAPCQVLIAAGANVFVSAPGSAIPLSSNNYLAAAVLSNSQKLLTTCKAFTGKNPDQLINTITPLLTQTDSDSGTDVSALANATDATGKTALHYAAAISDPVVAKRVCTLLLSAQADSSLKDKSNKTPVAYVPSANADIRALLAAGLPANTATPSDVALQTSLDLATKWFTVIGAGDAGAISDFLVNNPSLSINELNLNGNTALQVAAQKAGNVAICSLLLELGADITAIGSYDGKGVVSFNKNISLADKTITALFKDTLNLMFKATRAATTTSNIQGYLDAGAIPNAQGPSGNSVLHFVAANNVLGDPAGAAKNLALAIAFLNRGANALAQNTYGVMPISYVPVGSDLAKLLNAIQQLFSAVNPATPTTNSMSSGISAAFASISALSSDATLALVNARDGLGKTALHYAVAANNFDASKLLFITYNADPKAVDFSGKTPAKYLATASSASATAALIEALLFAPPSPVLIPSIVSGQISAATSSTTSSSITTQSSSTTALATTTTGAATSTTATVDPVAAWFAAINADASARTTSASTAFLAANSGFDVNTSDSAGKTALHYALKRNIDVLCQFLLAAGANVFAVDVLSSYALNATTSVALGLVSNTQKLLKGLQAAVFDAPAVTGLLTAVLPPPSNKKIGAVLAATDRNGNTALHYAAQDDVANGDAKLCQVLLNAKAPVNVKNNDGKTPLDFVPDTKSALSKLLVNNGAKLGANL